MGFQGLVRVVLRGCLSCFGVRWSGGWRGVRVLVFTKRDVLLRSAYFGWIVWWLLWLLGEVDCLILWVEIIFLSSLLFWFVVLWLWLSIGSFLLWVGLSFAILFLAFLCWFDLFVASTLLYFWVFVPTSLWYCLIPSSYSWCPWVPAYASYSISTILFLLLHLPLTHWSDSPQIFQNRSLAFLPEWVTLLAVWRVSSRDYLTLPWQW